MLIRPTWHPRAAWQLSLPAAIGWTILLALLFPLDVRGADDAEDEIPTPEEVVLKTSDGVVLHATYYPSIHEKDSVPIILLHGFKGNRHDFDKLALFLQERGHAVIAPDLRGHGESTSWTGGSEKIEAASLRQQDFVAMIEFDVEAVKGFLKEKNNEGELNIDKLAIVGCEMGALIAAAFARRDWEWAPLTTGKQGQDVKALVLISPEQNFKGLHLADAMSDAVRSQIAVLLIAGKKKSSAAQVVSRLYDSLKKEHFDEKKKDLIKLLPATSVQGVKMLGEPSLGVNKAINEFVSQLVKRPLPWAERKNPLD